MNREILVGDVLEKIKEIPDKSIDCVITSPPYWTMRDYSVKGQWGLESDYHQYLAKLGRLMDQLRRVLKDTGTCWINLGDTYNDKSRIGIPERFYINCIDNGWIARNNIVWAKNNAMPCSVKDRFGNKFESIFFFVKQQKYYFNLDAVREKPITPTKAFNVRVRDTDKARFLQNATISEVKTHNKKGEFMGKASKEYLLKWQKNEDSIHKTNPYHPKGKNPGDTWLINTTPYKEAHFATFPEQLPTMILKCGCMPGGIVLDPFFGSGTVGVSAEKLGLRWVGIELNNDYVKLAKKRLEKYKIQTHLHFHSANSDNNNKNLINNLINNEGN